MKNKKRVTDYIGNLMILLALGGLLFIYFPFIKIYIFPPKIQHTISGKGYYIQIPKINAQSPVILNVDPWNEKEYRQKLKMGVAHAISTSPPGEKGISYLFAHSSDDPWSIGRYNTIFFRLGELNINDEIFIFKDGKKNIYKVKDKKIVWPNEVEYLTKIDSQNIKGQYQLILQTCYPIGTAFKRLLIFAERR